jgi:hypothetical protein
MLKAATVRTYDKFTRAIGRRLGEALQQELEMTPNACWLFCPPLPGLEEMIKGICEGAGTDQLIGCTTDGEISDSGLSINSAVLGGIVSDTLAFEIVTIQGLEKNSMAAGRQLAASFSSAPAYLQIFSDGLTGNGCAILRGISDVLGVNIPVSGGAAGDSGDFSKTLQFGRGRVYSDAACAIGFYGDFKLGTAVKSGWSPIGLAKQVTRARGKTVYELNGEPALNVFERFLGQHAEKLPAIGVEYPLGFTSLDQSPNGQGQYLLRATMSVDRQERSITFAGEIPEGAMVNLTCGDKSSILKAAESAAKEASGALGNAMPKVVFCYSCMARKIVLGRKTEEEIDQVRARFGSHVPIIGFYSYGEFSPEGPAAPSHLHNETITLSVLGV